MVMKTVIGIDEAPSAVTMTGAMPVTRIVPARPMTNAPHHPVSRRRFPGVYVISVSTAVAYPVPTTPDVLSVAMPRPLDLRRPAADVAPSALHRHQPPRPAAPSSWVMATREPSRAVRDRDVS